MCCFSRKVQSVSDTSIFARFAERGQQYLVYSMKLKTDQALAMILPIPVKTGTAEDDVKFVSLEKYPDFFTDMNRGFPAPPAARSKSGGGGFGGAPPEPALKVVDVGSYEASFVPSVEDFKRLDERFRLPDGTWDKLPTYKKYGFAVFKLKEGEQKVHPMAFQFPTRGRRLFFPTVHIHDGNIHKEADFDHQLYCQLTGGDSSKLFRFRESPQPAGMFMDTIKSEGLIEPDEHCHQRRINGRQKNDDVWV